MRDEAEIPSLAKQFLCKKESYSCQGYPIYAVAKHYFLNSLKKNVCRQTKSRNMQSNLKEAAMSHSPSKQLEK